MHWTDIESRQTGKDEAASIWELLDPSLIQCCCPHKVSYIEIRDDIIIGTGDGGSELNSGDDGVLTTRRHVLGFLMLQHIRLHRRRRTPLFFATQS